MSIINWPFAWIMKFCLMISGEYYWLALLFFALIMALLLLPFGIKQQKSQIQSASFKPTERAIRNKYKGRTDSATQQKMMAEIQEEQQKAGINMFGGCLPMIIQLALVLILYAIVRAPITYSFEFGEDKETTIDGLYSQAVDIIQSYKDAADPDSENYEAFIKELNAYQEKLGGKKEDSEEEQANPVYKFSSQPSYGEYDLLKIIKDKGTVSAVAEKYGIEIDKSLVMRGFSDEISDKLPNFEFFGMSLLDIPNTQGFSLILLIPLLVFLTQFASTKISRKFMPQQLDANGNPVGGGLFMEVGLPLMSAVFSYSSFSAAIGVYWIWRTIIAVLQTVLLNKTMPLPTFTEEEYAEAERKYKGKQKKKKKKITIEVDEDDERYAEYIASGSDKSENNETKYTYSERVEMLTAEDDSSDVASPGSDDEML